ncbi:MAG: hypothetical protein IJT02_04690 [Synergistaceae bacterium]|nr:hypothetical protein [Synergistaceae bacterium]
MPATVTTSKIRVNVKLNNGTTATGATKTVSVSLGNLNKDAFDADKAISIVSLLSPVLDKSIVTVEKVETSTVSQ